MNRSFNIAGPNRVDRHYTLPVIERVPEVLPLVHREDWFVLHAPRQSGKTTVLKALAAELTASGRYAALRATCEAGEPFRDDPAAASRIVIDDIFASAALALPAHLQPPAPSPTAAAGRDLAQFLTDWCRACPLPVVLFLDEIDALQDDALLAVLRQLRSIFDHRPGAAPSTVALVGLRDLRDYKVRSGGGPNLGTASPFNVTARSLTLSAFTRAEVAALYGQHTAETGQAFTEAALDRAWHLTRGQPWLVNALARQAVEELAFAGTLDVEHIDVAKERLVVTRSTHLESLAHKLTEARVRAVLEPILTGERLPLNVSDADIQYCEHLGLITGGNGSIAIANPIYREVLPRELTHNVGRRITTLDDRRWARPDGGLDLDGLLAAFVHFWKKDGEWMVRGQGWPEAAHQLVLMAFLQRVINGGGTIEREYGLGRGRIDLLVRWALQVDASGAVRAAEHHAIEIKVWRDTHRDDVLAEGLSQLDEYLARLATDATGTLVLFDARSTAPTGEAWSQRGIRTEAITPAGRQVRLLLA